MEEPDFEESEVFVVHQDYTFSQRSLVIANDNEWHSLCCYDQLEGEVSEYSKLRTWSYCCAVSMQQTTQLSPEGIKETN